QGESRSDGLSDPWCVRGLSGLGLARFLLLGWLLLGRRGRLEARCREPLLFLRRTALLAAHGLRSGFLALGDADRQVRGALANRHRAALGTRAIPQPALHERAVVRAAFGDDE